MILLNILGILYHYSRCALVGFRCKAFLLFFSIFFGCLKLRMVKHVSTFHFPLRQGLNRKGCRSYWSLFAETNKGKALSFPQSECFGAAFSVIAV